MWYRYLQYITVGYHSEQVICGSIWNKNGIFRGGSALRLLHTHLNSRYSTQSKSRFSNWQSNWSKTMQDHYVENSLKGTDCSLCEKEEAIHQLQLLHKVSHWQPISSLYIRVAWGPVVWNYKRMSMAHQFKPSTCCFLWWFWAALADSCSWTAGVLLQIQMMLPYIPLFRTASPQATPWHHELGLPVGFKWAKIWLHRSTNMQAFTERANDTLPAVANNFPSWEKSKALISLCISSTDFTTPQESRSHRVIVPFEPEKFQKGHLLSPAFIK